MDQNLADAVGSFEITPQFQLSAVGSNMWLDFYFRPENSNKKIKLVNSMEQKPVCYLWDCMDFGGTIKNKLSLPNGFELNQL